MPIDSRHPNYTHRQSQWQRARIVATGSDAVKAAGSLFLPKPSGMSHQDFSAYLRRGLFYSATARTIAGLTGAIFQKDPVANVPDRTFAALKDVTLTGVPLNLFALEIVREQLTVGRAGILVDMAIAPAVRPYFVSFAAEDIVSWRIEYRAGDQILTRVVLRERLEHVDPKDEYVVTIGERYRELALDNGVYTVRVHTKLPAEHLVDPSQTRWVVSERVIPLRRGKPLTFIPFCFVNATSTTTAIDRPPLDDLIVVNVSHFMSSAELEHLLHFVASPTPWASGFDAKAGTLKIGSSIAWLLEKDGKAGMLEMSGAGAAAIRDNLDAKHKMMATLGARLLEDQPKGSETATAVNMRHAGEHATLRTIASVAEAGISTALQWMSWWTGIEETPADTGANIKLNTDFVSAKMTADELRALVLAWQASGMSFETLHHNLSRGDLMRPGISAEEERHAIQAAERSEDTEDDAA